jgi:hypothetical protein
MKKKKMPWGWVITFTVLLALVYSTNFDSNVKAYEANHCAVYGMQPDCKTPLTK